MEFASRLLSNSIHIGIQILVSHKMFYQILYKGLKILEALLNSFDTLHSYKIYSNNKFLQQKDVKKQKKAIIKLNWNMPTNY